MKIDYSKKFSKQFKQLPAKTQKQFWKRLELFIVEPDHPLLRQHSLKGKLSDYHSFNVSGDVRAIFKRQGEIMLFVAIGSHSQLYWVQN